MPTFLFTDSGQLIFTVADGLNKRGICALAIGLQGAVRTAVLLATLLSLFAARDACADEYSDSSPGDRYVHAALLADQTVIQPSTNEETPALRVGLRLKIEEGWHIYWINSGDSGMPTKVSWTVPGQWRVSELRWPAPERIHERGGLISYGYRDEVILIADLFTPQEIPQGNESVEIAAVTNFLVCKDICVPGRSSASLALPFDTSRPQTASAEFAALDQADASTPLPLSAIEDLSALAGSEVQLVLAQDAVVQGQEHEMGIVVRNVPPAAAKEFINGVQVFPKKSAGIVIGLPKAAPLVAGRSDGPQPTDFLITLPLKVSGSAPIGNTEVAGVLVFAPSVTGAQPRSFNWSLPLTVRKAGTDVAPNPLFVESRERRAAPVDLVYRAVTEPANEASLDTAVANGASASGILIALLCAFAAGLILNLMPCVLPIVSIKVFSIVKSAASSRRERFAMATAYAAGIEVSFLVLAALVISLKELGHAVGWGFQFQHPGFVVVLFLIVFALSLSLFEIFSCALPGMQEANKLVSAMQPSLRSNFLDGMLATALSTPCTAPFLGTALAFAFSQSGAVTVAIFAAIGAGLALPYIYLVTHPKLAAYLPKPGPWMHRFKQLMGFLLLATALWLLFILDRLTDQGAVWAVAIALLLFTGLWLDDWIAERFETPARRSLARVLLLCVFSVLLLERWPALTARSATVDGSELHASSEIAWEPYSEERLEAATAAGRPIFIDFTAAWCVTCKFNEQFAIETSAVAVALKEADALALKADWTDGNEEVTAALRRYGAQGVPLYVAVPPTGEPIVLPTIVTSGMITDALRQAARGAAGRS